MDVFEALHSRRSLRAFLKDRLPLDTLCRLAEPGTGFDADLWRGLGELGLHGLLVPEEDGGAGLGPAKVQVSVSQPCLFADIGELVECIE